MNFLLNKLKLTGIVSDQPLKNALNSNSLSGDCDDCNEPDDCDCDCAC